MGADTIIAVDVNHCIFRGREPARAQPSAEAADGAGQDHPMARRFLDRMRERLKDRARKPGSPPFRAAALPNIFDILGNSIQIMQVRITQSRLKSEPPDLLIRPEVGDIGFMDFHRAREAMAAGYAAAMEDAPP